MSPKIGTWPVFFEVSNVKNASAMCLTPMPKKEMKQEVSKIQKKIKASRKKRAFAEPLGKNIKRGEDILKRGASFQNCKKKYVQNVHIWPNHLL